MPGDDLVSVVRQWIAKAENDLKNASHSLKLGKECPTDTVGFHAQQCIEKYIKATLLMSGSEFPKVHDLEKLVRLLPHGVLADWKLSEQRRITAYAAMTRYPGDYEPITLAEARAAVRITRKIRSDLRRLMPRTVTAAPRAVRRSRKRR